MSNTLTQQSASRKLRRMIAYWRRYWPYYLFLLPAVLDVLVFHYFPLYGVQIAFKNYKVRAGIWGSEWVGLTHFAKFIESPMFVPLLRNTLLISVQSLIVGFPIPIILALLLNEMRNERVKRIVQTITYAPHFLSTVAVVGLLNLLLARDTGILNLLREALGMGKLNFLTTPEYFRPIYVLSGVWQNTGWDSIIYLAALSAVDVEIVEAAKIDGTNRLQTIRYIYIPTILPTIVILLIMRSGSLLSVGYEKILLMQNDLIRDVSEVISTYTYRLGIINGQYSYTTAIGLFNSVVNAVILVTVNFIAGKVNETSLW